MTKSIILALAAAGAVLCSADANARGHVSWSVGINAPVVGAVISNGPAYGYGYPAYGYPVYESYPAYAPAPYYVQPAPVYYGPAPVIYGAPAYYYHGHGYRGHGYYGNGYYGHGQRSGYYPAAPHPRHGR